MNLGAEPKKVAILIALVVVAGAGLYYNSASDTSSSPAPRPPAASTEPVPSPVPEKQTSRAPGRPVNSEFRPRVPGSRPDDKLDISKIDPDLRLDLLAKVQAVQPMEAGRNLFQFGAAPAPPKPMLAVPKNVPKIPVNHVPAGPPQQLAKAGPPAAPPVQPINLKYYGYVISKTDGHKEAFLLDGDDILKVVENQTVKSRYRIVKIAPGSIDIEDTQAKNTQTLKFQELPA